MKRLRGQRDSHLDVRARRWTFGCTATDVSCKSGPAQGDHSRFAPSAGSGGATPGGRKARMRDFYALVWQKLGKKGQRKPSEPRITSILKHVDRIVLRTQDDSLLLPA